MKSDDPVFESIFQHESKRSVLAFELAEASFVPFWHFHPEIELTLITQGNGIRFVGDNIESYQAGDLVLIGENLPHHWVSTDDADGQLQRAVVVQFQMKFFEELAELNSLYQFIRAAEVGYHFPNPDKSISKRIEALPHIPPPLRVSQLIEVLFDLYKKAVPRKLSRTTKFNILSSTKEQKRINEAIGFIVDNLNQKLSVNRIADECCMVPQAFCRWFRKHTGFSFITYLNKTRIESACQYLLTTDRPVKLVAYEVGFESISNFNRTFKKYVGVSPLEFKSRHLSRVGDGEGLLS